MLKKLVILLGLLLSPLISLIGLTPITIIPAIVLAKIVTQSDCANETGESLCGLGEATIFAFILNAIFGLSLTIYLNLQINKNRKTNIKYFSSLIILIYFIVITSLFFYLI